MLTDMWSQVKSNHDDMPNKCDVTAMSSPLSRVVSSCLAVAPSWCALAIFFTQFNQNKMFNLVVLLCPVLSKEKNEHWSHIVHRRWVFLSMLPVLRCNAQFQPLLKTVLKKINLLFFVCPMHCVILYHIIDSWWIARTHDHCYDTKKYFLLN